MGKVIDLTNQVFGDLTVIERAGSSKDKKALWLCQCSCGNTHVVLGKLLRQGKITHCGCKNKTTVNDILNQSFGRLTVIARAGSDNSHKALWLCKCNCGKQIVARGSDLISKKIISCGCYKQEISSPDLTNKRFGQLTVIKKSKSRNNQIVWLCECDCGNEIEVTTNHLTTGNTQSCGCLVSKSENQIANYLKSKQINYIQQFTFLDLLGKNNTPLRFDFAIINNNKILYLIEYQGIQHYQNVYGLTEENWQYSLERDNMKRNYCKIHNIPLYEIKYNDNILVKLEKIINDN